MIVKFLNNLFSFPEEFPSSFGGLTKETYSILLASLCQKEKRSILVVTASLYEANILVDSLSTYLEEVYLFPMDDFLTSEAVAMSPDLKIRRLETLSRINCSTPKIVVTNLMGYLRYLPLPNVYQKCVQNIKKGDEISPKEFIQNLYHLGYQKETIVTNTGEMAERGFIVDVFPLLEDHPVRFEFFGDMIESIRYFDEKNQKSLTEIHEVTIYPFTEFLTLQEQELFLQKYLPEYGKVASIYDYLKNPILIYQDDTRIETTYRSIQEEIFTYQTTKDIEFKGKYMHELPSFSSRNILFYSSVDNYEKNQKFYDFHIQSLPKFNEDIESIRNFIQKNLQKDKYIIVALKDYQLPSFAKQISISYQKTTFDKLLKGCINLVPFEMQEGFLYKDYVFLTANELFNVQKPRKTYKNKYKYATKIHDLNKLNKGDYVVHEVHGIGIYRGIKTLSQMGLEKDYLEVEYLGKDKLYIPVEKIELLSKYTGKEGIRPTIHKLGGTVWTKTKERIRSKVQDMTKQLLALYAKRESQKGYAFSPDTELQKHFEQAFPYKLTSDQSKALLQIKEDMEKESPMDRLLCGDVGFGKTEVAFCAAFKAINDSKQVLFLCPTTILSNQHYQNAKERFHDFPVSMALLNRFTPMKEVKRILNGLKDGTIDMVFGTHRLLSDDIHPKDLGLLIIDEEQRFGVKHKEKIKQYKTNIDVLTLTATPIPRTLQMSIVGIRSLSLIETAPMDRYPIQTYVLEENMQVIKDAIYKELSRYGQVFILYNRVESIERQLLKIQNLVPDAKITFAHGQMSREKIEDRMFAFMNHEYDILLCTTIIETGIDIPNVNTLIILNADQFGLSQLYQIRGRVGRSNKIAYAYLMYQSQKVLTETAMKRLNVIKEFTELGSGFSIATRDLSIRGAGDILGSEQAGFIDTIGIDLYLKMLNEEVVRQKGQQKEESITTENETKPLLSVSTHIKDEYVKEEELKIEIHRKINEIQDKKSFQSVKEELEDRFGTLPEEMIIYMHEEWFENLAKKLPVHRVRQMKNMIEMNFTSEFVAMIDTEKLFVDAFHITPMFRFKSSHGDLTILLDTIRLEKHPVFYLVQILESLYLQKTQK